MSLVQTICKRAAILKKRILFPEAEKDIRVIRAALTLFEEKFCIPVLMGSREKIEELGTQHGLSLPGNLAVTPFENSQTEDEKFLFFDRKVSYKKFDSDQLRAISSDPLHIAGWMLASDRADGAVAGSVAATSDVIRAALRTAGVSAGSSIVSSTFLMELPAGQVFTYADCGVVPYPDAEQLASIAVDSGETHRRLTGQEPVVAFLSFSTYGSARHERVDLVRNAFSIAKEMRPGWKMDGELQFDTACLPEVAKRKAPGSPVAGKANVFIFPNLDAANIGYKITERLAGATATGPILQGLARPYMDLSRGCSAGDIVNAASVAALLGVETR